MDLKTKVKKNLCGNLRIVVEREVEKTFEGHEGRKGKRGGSLPRESATNIVGITSARPKDDVNQSHTNPEVYRDMKRFESDLGKIKGVKNSSVTFGKGAWKNGGEPTWIVQYEGNGEARKLCAKYGKDHNQDSVLMMGGDKYQHPNAQKSIMGEMEFSGRLTNSVRTKIESAMTELGFPAWTWYKNGKDNGLRLTRVPQWSEPDYTDASHEKNVRKVNKIIRKLGLNVKRSRISNANIEVMNREGSYTYDEVANE